MPVARPAARAATSPVRRDDNVSLRNGGKTRLDDADAVKPVHGRSCCCDFHAVRHHEFEIFDYIFVVDVSLSTSWPVQRTLNIPAPTKADIRMPHLYG